MKHFSFERKINNEHEAFTIIKSLSIPDQGGSILNSVQIGLFYTQPVGSMLILISILSMPAHAY